MNKTLSEIEFETRTIGPLVLTTPFLRRLGVRETINRWCPVAEQADFDYGLVAELVIQCRWTDRCARYDRPGWAAQYEIAALYPDVDEANQRNDDRVGRLLDALYERRAMLWGEGHRASSTSIRHRPEPVARRYHADQVCGAVCRSAG